ncbi:MAG: VWA domain-containing protein [Candidatus Riflebacteria bacterium]|nr:VWA domain-containing protein [Candidatus Riflebacteria bacterium]
MTGSATPAGSKWAAVLVWLALGSAAVLAGPEDLGVEIHKISIDSFPRMQVSLTLVDRTGRVLKGLESRNFRVFEAGHRVKLEDVAVDRTPVVAAICVDSSGSMTSSIDSVKRAAGLFIRLLDEDDQAEIVSFADDPRLVSPRTSDKAVLLGRLHTLVAYGATALHDAMWRCLSDLKGLPGRRVVVLLTDGQDQNRDGTARLSRHTLEEVLKLARSEKVPFFTIRLGRRVLQDELANIAKTSGGRSYAAPRPADLEDIYRQIAALVKSQVLLTYRSPNSSHDGKWRAVEVRASAEERQGSTREVFRAPGRYVLDVNGQGYDRLRMAELAQELPQVNLYDTVLESVVAGKPSELLGWLLRYFARPPGEGGPPAAPAPPAPPSPVVTGTAAR